MNVELYKCPSFQTITIKNENIIVFHSGATTGISHYKRPDKRNRRESKVLELQISSQEMPRLMVVIIKHNI